ncbi:hypothetical protein THAOC_04988 [Thalassiosira oceanica]|uniref:Uncharacterized protein n=1 Tax=Thalassiosira oceanica TaxID=159749 RepID=K0T6U5_THAOC|nr:hypothetical protein THAOC_04988 [Thalassiosira oceanica]|eukprot:EJK73390.1 hypothetical protein THAOC_04988 [Thalassiosira oceanica]
MKRICAGCYVAAKERGMFDCPFCRAAIPDNDADNLTMLRARVRKKDPMAINLLGEQYFYGGLGIQKDMRRAVEMYTEAAELGSVEALFSLRNANYHGNGVQQDKAKGIKFYKKAAMQGRAMTKMGDKDSLESIKEAFMVGGVATKEHYAEALKDTKPPLRK